MKISSFDIKGALIVAIALLSALQTCTFLHEWMRQLDGVIVTGLVTYRGYLSMPPATPDTTTLTTKVDTPGVTKSDIVDTT